MYKPSRYAYVRAAVLLVLSLLPITQLDAARWRKISPEEFAMTEPVVDPESGAEILFSEARLEQEFTEFGTSGSFQYYIRVKVFTDKGVEELSQMEFTYSKGREIRRVEGRTVKPDGTAIEIDSDNIYDQEVIRKGRSNIRAVSFAFPNLEAGDIVEFQYSKRTGREAFVVEMDFLESLPSQRVYRYLKPFQEVGVGDKILTFQMPGIELKKNRRGAYEFEFNNLPAKPDEPYSFPELHLGPYVVLYYFNFEPGMKNYWRDRSKELYSDGRRKLKPSREIETFVKDYTKDADTIVEKLGLLYQWCQSEPQNVNYSYGVYTDKEREELKENYSPQDTFERKYGYPSDINELFGAMARSLGLEAQLASTNDIRGLIFNEGLKAFFALDDKCVAVKVGEEWRFYNPGLSPFLPYDSLPWWACGSPGLIGHRKDKFMQTVPMPKAEYSVLNRTGDFAVDDTGKLTGTVTMVLTGFQDLDMKESLSRRFTDEEEEEYIIQELKENLANVKASNFRITNRSSRSAITIKYDLEVPEYADVTSKRIFIQPAVFQKGADPVFTEDNRHGNLLFPYPWTDKDDITIQMPNDFKLEEGSAPKPFNMGVVGTYETKLGLTKSNKIKYSRNFAFNLRMAEKKYYGGLKDALTIVNQIDQHTLTFKRVEEDEVEAEETE